MIISYFMVHVRRTWSGLSHVNEPAERLKYNFYAFDLICRMGQLTPTVRGYYWYRLPGPSPTQLQRQLNMSHCMVGVCDVHLS